MMRIGTKIVHCLHGVGVVEAIEHKEILGNTTEFAVIAFDRMKIMVNLGGSNSMIRELIPEEEVPKVLDHLASCDTSLPSNHAKRYNLNLERVKSGDVYQLATVIRSLTALSHEKKLGIKDQKILDRAKNVLSQELSYVAGWEQEATLAKIENLAAASCEPVAT